MAYSTDKREQAMELCQKGQTNSQVKEMTGVSTQTLNNWKKLLFTTGSLQKKKINRPSGKPYKYTPDKIKALLNKSAKPPKATASEPAKSKSSGQILLSPQKPKKDKKKDKKKTKKCTRTTIIKFTVTAFRKYTPQCTPRYFGDCRVSNRHVIQK